MSTNIVNTLQGAPPSGFISSIPFELEIPDWETPSHKEIRRKGWRQKQTVGPLGTTEYEARNSLGWAKGLTTEFTGHHYHDLSGMVIRLYEYDAAHYNAAKKYAYPTDVQRMHDLQVTRRHLAELRGVLERRGLYERWTIWQYKSRRQFRIIRLPHIDKNGLHRAMRQQPSAREILAVKEHRPVIYPPGWIAVWKLAWLRDAKLLTPLYKLPDY